MQINFSPYQIDYNNRAVAYGDGCFTTLCWHNGELQDWPYHVNRLERACQALQLKGFDAVALSQFMHSEVLLNLPPKCVLKILVSVAAGGRGYSRSINPEISVFVSEHPFPTFYQDWQQNGVRLGLSHVALAKQPALSGHKHLNRLEQVLIKNTAVDNIDDWIAVDTDGMLVEASASNLFWRCTEQWYTPDLHFCGVAGIVREKLLSHLKKSVPVSIIRAKPATLKQADEVIICNSLMGLVPVKSITLGDEVLSHFEVRSAFFHQLNSGLVNREE